MSHRPNPSTDDPILEAARATVLDFGVRRTTVSEVARRAGLSRMTVYRRYPEADGVLRALMAREFSQVLEQAQAEARAEGDARRRLVAETLRTVELLGTHPVLLRMLEVDAEQLLPYFTGARGRFQLLALARVRELIEEGQRAGAIRAGDPAAIAEALELALRGVVLAARALDDAGRRSALAELRAMLERYLRPE